MSTFPATVLLWQHHGMSRLLPGLLWLAASQQVYSVSPRWLQQVSTFILEKTALLTAIANPHCVKMHIKKTSDLFRQGTDIYLRAKNRPICPASMILPYQTVRAAQTGLLFINIDGKSLTGLLFNEKILRCSPRDSSSRHNQASVKKK